MTGIEPMTNGLKVQRSTLLSYTSIVIDYIYSQMSKLFPLQRPLDRRYSSSLKLCQLQLRWFVWELF
jgi:hypothetical protein